MTALPLVAALAWILAVVVDPGPLGSTGALLTGVGLLLITTVAVIGMTLTGARWSHRLGLLGVGCGLIVAGFRPIDVFWLIGLVMSVVAGAALFMPGVTGRMRKLPAAAGPPETAVVLSILLIAFPFALGLVAGSSEGWAVLVVGLSAPLFGFGFARVIPGGLIGVRLVWPLLAIGLAAPFLSITPMAITVIASVGVVALAWRPEVKASFHPPREAGTTYPIPPELAPPDILDAAGLDEKGRRR